MKQVTICHLLKMRAADGKMRLTDVADTILNRYHISDMGWKNRKRIQTAQRLEERKPSRQHDQRGTCAEYACRTISNKHNKSQKSPNTG